MFTLESSIWSSTIGIAAASQIVNRTSAPVVAIQDPGTVPQQVGRRIHITGIVQQEPVRHSKGITFNRSKRRQASAKKKSSVSRTTGGRSRSR